MRIGAVLCAVIGHRWRVDETSTDSEAHIGCARCGRQQLAPDGTMFDRRLDAEARADRAIGPQGTRGP